MLDAGVRIRLRRKERLTQSNICKELESPKGFLSDAANFSFQHFLPLT